MEQNPDLGKPTCDLIFNLMYHQPQICEKPYMPLDYQPKKCVLQIMKSH